jgi:hypothetical protein
METAYVICIDDKHFLGKDDCAFAKIRSANMYQDTHAAQEVLDRLVRRYKDTTNIFFNDATKLTIKEIKITLC